MSTTTKFTPEVSRDEALDFAGSAFRNWLYVPPFTLENADEAAAALTAFLKRRGFVELYEALNDLLTASQPQRSDRPGFIYLEEAQERAIAALAKVEAPRG